MKALREGLQDEHQRPTLPGITGRYETDYGLTGKVPIEKGVGQGAVLSPVRAKLILAVVQGAVNKVCPGYRLRMDGRRLAMLLIADDACLLAGERATGRVRMHLVGIEHIRTQDAGKGEQAEDMLGGHVLGKRGREGHNGMGHSTAQRHLGPTDPHKS